MSEKLGSQESWRRCEQPSPGAAQRDANGVIPIRICMGASCIASGARRVQESLVEQLAEQGLSKKAEICEVGCLGPCSGGPVLVVGDVFYEHLRPQDCGELVRQHLGKGVIVDRLTHRRPDGRHISRMSEVDFFRRQTKLVLGKCGRIDPQRIDDYIGDDGYQALARVLAERNADTVLGELRKSGLRGRGGAGFPTWRKWDFTRKADGDAKFVVCNADEGDPGAFMDRSILEGDPHAVMEGMAIAAFTIGARQGFIYVRAEYPLAVERLKVAIAQARERGLLGENILGSGFSFDLELRMGSGAFVCGEETALLTSIEGNRGEPRPRPPFPAQRGLWGKPTLLNNVETYANVPRIRDARRSRIRAARDGEEPRHEGVRVGRRHQELRPGGSAHRHAAGGPDLRHRGWHSRRQGVQGRADGRSLGRLHSEAALVGSAGL